MTPLRRIVRLSGAFIGSDLARAAIGFGLSLALGRALGAERFGRWALCTAWAATLTAVADLGFGALLTRDGARGEADHGALVASALATRTAFILPVGAAFALAAPAVGADAESIAGLRVGVLLAVASAAYGCFGAIFRGAPRWLPAVLGLETAGAAAQLAGAWCIVGAGGGIVSLLALATAIQIAQVIVAMVLWQYTFARRTPLRLVSRHALVAFVRRALPFAASGVVANLQVRLGPLMLGSLSTAAELGWFAAASRLATLAKLAPHALFSAALPVLTNDFGRDRATTGGTVRRFACVLWIVTIAGAAPCIALAAPLVALAYGRPFAAAAPSLMWLGLALVPTVTNSGSKVALYAAGGESMVVRWSTVALVVQAAAGVILIPTLGSVGAAMSAGVAEAAIWLPLRRTATARARQGFHLLWTSSP